MTFDSNTSPLLTPYNIATTPSYELGSTSNVVGDSAFNTGVIWGGPGGTFKIVTTGNLAQIAQLSTRGLVAINVPGSSVVSALITAGTGVSVTEVGNDFLVALVPSSTVQNVKGRYNSIAVGAPRDTVNLIAGANTSVSLADSGTSLNWTINADGGAAVDGPFVITQADSDLTGAQNLGVLATGYVYSTVSTGVSTLSTVSGSTFATLAGTQTFTGTNTFSIPPVMSGASIIAGSIPVASVTGTAMTLSTTQTVTGLKTFTLQQVFSNSIKIPLGASAGKVLGSDASGNATWVTAGAGDVTLAGTQTFTGTNTFSIAPVMSGASITAGTIAAAGVSGTALTLSGTQTVTAVKTFTPQQVFTNSIQIPLGAGAGKVLGSDGSGNATWVTAATGDALLAGTQTFTGTNTFSVAPVMSGASITSGTVPAASVVGTAMTLSAVQTVTAIKTFTPQQVFTNSIQIPLGAGNGKVLGSDVSGNATWVIAAVGDATLAGTQTFTGTNTFSVPPVMSGASITAGTIPVTAVAGMASATVSTTDATPTTLATVAISSNTAVTINGFVVARNTSGTINNTTGGRFTCTAVNTGGVVTLAATPDVTTQSTSTGTFNVVVSGTNLIVQVTGIAATNYSWSTTYTAISL